LTGPWTTHANGASLHLRVTPNASRSAIEGVELRDDGSAVLRVRVTAPPDKGKANKAVIALIAKNLGLSKSAVIVKRGETARIKTLALTGDPEALDVKLAELTAKTA